MKKGRSKIGVVDLHRRDYAEKCLLFLLPLYLDFVVARDGLEPPTPAFSGPRSTN